MQVLNNISLKPYNTFGVDVKADTVVCFASEAEVVTYFANKTNQASLQMVMGSGSNLLFRQDFKGIIYKIENKGISLEKKDADHVYLKIAAGEIWDDVVAYCVEQGWGGIENLSLVPGTAGAATVQNIGAYGVEIAERIVWVDAVDRCSGRCRRFAKEELHYAYRYSDFKTDKHSCIITQMGLCLDVKPQLVLHYKGVEDYLQSRALAPNVQNVRQAIIAIRESKLPALEELGNAGSFFKNPVVTLVQYEQLKSKYSSMPAYDLGGEAYKIPAAWLIQHSGAQALSVGDAQVYEKHALILVNKAAAKGSEVVALAEAIQNKVKEVFAIDIELEVLIV